MSFGEISISSMVLGWGGSKWVIDNAYCTYTV